MGAEGKREVLARERNVGAPPTHTAVDGLGLERVPQHEMSRICVRLFSPHQEMEGAGVCAIGFGSCQYVEIKAGGRALCLVSR